jgi:soluble lytic murein transglycosylase
MQPNRDHRSPELDRSPPDRDARASLSSVATRYLIPAAVLLSIGTAATALTMQQPMVAPEGLGTKPAAPTSAIPPLPPESDPLWGAINSWNRLRQSDGLPFADYASFLLAHRGWPGEIGLRRAAERAIQPDITDPRLVASFLTTFPPQTSAGRVRLAEALAASGRTGEAQTAATTAWVGGALSSDDEARLTARFGTGFTQADQDRRMERLLWSNATSSAQRQLALVSPARQPLYATRLAFQTRAPDAASIMVSGADRDPGYAIDRANWLRNSERRARRCAPTSRRSASGTPPLSMPRSISRRCSPPPRVRRPTINRPSPSTSPAMPTPPSRPAH